MYQNHRVTGIPLFRFCLQFLFSVSSIVMVSWVVWAASLARRSYSFLGSFYLQNNCAKSGRRLLKNTRSATQTSIFHRVSLPLFLLSSIHHSVLSKMFSLKDHAVCVFFTGSFSHCPDLATASCIKRSSSIKLLKLTWQRFSFQPTVPCQVEFLRNSTRTTKVAGP